MSSSIDARVIQDEKSTGTVVRLHPKFLFSVQEYFTTPAVADFYGLNYSLDQTE